MKKLITALVWLFLATVARADNKDDFLAAREALARSDLREVAARAEALSRDPLGIYPRYWLLSRQLPQLGPDQLLPFLNYYQGSWLAEKLRGEWLALLGRNADWTRFREQYRLLIDAPSTELLCYSLQGRLAEGDKTAPGNARALVWFTAKDLPAACDPVIEHLLATGTVTRDDIWARLRLALEDNAQGLARALARRLDAELPAKDLEKAAASPAAWLKAPTGDGRLRQELAAFAIARLARSDVDAAASALGEWQPRLGAEVEPYAWRRLATVAAFRLDGRAEDWFRRSAGLPWSDYALEWRARIAIRMQDWDTVATAIGLMDAAGQQERAWQYWLGRAREARGEKAEAQRLFAGLSLDDDYYGLLARERLGPVVGPAQGLHQVTEEDFRRVAAHAALQRALLLNEMGLRFDAVREWNWALRGADDRLLLAAAEVARDASWYDRAIYAAERTKKLHNYELRYLAPYRDIVKDYAEQTGLDEAWVFGLMRQESRFVSGARSGVGAGGLMQLMPGTARWVAGKLGIPYKPDMVNDAGLNVRLGTYYLRHVLDNLSSNPVLATAGYNAGPNRARDWQHPDLNLEAPLYIESIPFGETRDYVKKVMTNAVHYGMTFGQGRMSLVARLGSIPPRNPRPVEGP
ncbi:MAG TPA: transglycosylase SLT domain-containing protein [Moraxellaceae bacterium]|nr:transglycosylase SLT domain-containing protein [Moraxellaceae bacterium]